VSRNTAPAQKSHFVNLYTNYEGGHPDQMLCLGAWCWCRYRLSSESSQAVNAVTDNAACRVRQDYRIGTPPVLTSVLLISECRCCSDTVVFPRVIRGNYPVAQGRRWCHETPHRRAAPDAPTPNVSHFVWTTVVSARSDAMSGGAMALGTEKICKRQQESDN